MFKTSHDLCDTVSVVAFCPADGTAMITQETGTLQEYWIPSSRVPSGYSWAKQATKDVKEIFGSGVSANKLLRLYQLWMPNHRVSCIHHCVFEIHVTAEEKKNSRNAIGKGKIRWVTEIELKKFYANFNLKSPELLDFYTFGKTVNTMPFNEASDGFIQVGNLVEVDESIIITGKATIYDQIINTAGLDRKVQEVLYKEFLFRCFPANYMGLQIFSKFLADMGLPKEDTMNYFRSADVHMRNGISFRELLYFIAAVEPGTNHGGPSAELRCRFIFRFFDVDRNNLLKYDEIKNFVIAIRKSKKQPLDNASVSKDVSECFRNMNLPENHQLNISDFLHAVGELKVRGTSQIYRSAISIRVLVKDIQERDAKLQTPQRENSSYLSRPTIQRTTSKPYEKGPGYELAVHTVRVCKSGTMINVEKLFTLETAISVSSTQQPVYNELVRQSSIDQFNQTSDTNELLKAIRYLHQMNRKMQAYVKGPAFQYNWGQVNAYAVAKYIISISDHVRNLFMKEPRLLDVNSPVYIMGDLHGNLTDLLYFENIFWHIGPGLCPCNLLFLGDYVDRGAYSLEVISYLFAYKLQSPTKVNLLRGNHEIKRVQMQWTFEKECKSKFGDKVGDEVFNAINAAFDTMPLAAVVDGRVFCCHGGVPPPWLCPMATAINDIPVLLHEPQEQSPLSWELMWNDPIKPNAVTEKVAMELLTNDGFAVNVRRGTAHIFSSEALERFLKCNGFTHFIRAHEVATAGFNVQQKGKLLTVFSSSKYCNGKNEAACVLADQGKLRILRLETQ